MNKAIMIADKPIWCGKIMNGDKTIEVRSSKALYKATIKLIEEQGYATFFMYCTKDKTPLFKYISLGNALDMWDIDLPQNKKEYSDDVLLNGKVVAKFTVRKVGKIRYFLTPTGYAGWSSEHTIGTIIKNACLTPNELALYLSGKNDGYGYAYHIEDLVIFDEPKELSEFKKCLRCPVSDCRYCKYNKTIEGDFYCTKKTLLTKAPQNFCYVESDE